MFEMIRARLQGTQRGKAVRSIHDHTNAVVTGDELTSLYEEEWKAYSPTLYPYYSPDYVKKNYRDVYLAFVEVFLKSYTNGQAQFLPPRPKFD